MLSIIKNIAHIHKSRLSLRLVLWVFLSVIVIEGIILIPSYSSKRAELLGQLKAVSMSQVELIAKMVGPNPSDHDVLKLFRSHLLRAPVLGGRLYAKDGDEIGTFGDNPALDHLQFKRDNRRELLVRDDYRYDVVIPIATPAKDYILILCHDALEVKHELLAFILRIAGLVVIISIFVTAGAWLAINPLIVTPILNLRRDLINVGEAIRKDRKAPRFKADNENRRDELGDVIGAFRRMFDQIQEAIDKRKGAENSLQQSLEQVEAYSQALNNELEKGRHYQRDFLPKRLPQLSNWEIAAAFFPARQVSGDFYDVFELPDNLVGLVIGDVADKGVGAALYMALLRSLIRIFSGHYQFISETKYSDIVSDFSNQADILRAVDRTNIYLLQTHGDEGMFASLFFGVLNPSNGRLAYVNAGHEPLFVLETDGNLKRLNHTGPGVGLLQDYRYRSQEITIKPGGTLVGYTDGVSEARSPFDEFYSRRRLQRLLEMYPSESAENTVEKIRAELFNFIGDSQLMDDITIIAVRCWEYESMSTSRRNRC